MKKLDYTIVTPSRKRTHLITHYQQLVPSAVICVDEREYDDYAPLVPKEKLLVHPPMDGLHRIINWMQDAIDSEILISIDDDLRCVQRNVGKRKRFFRSDDILQIIENSARCADDIGCSTFTWSKTGNAMLLAAEYRPFHPVQSISGALGIMGPARHRRYDTTLLARADVDWTLRTLLEDRFTMADLRYWFDFGRVYGGRGGNVGLVTPNKFKKVSIDIKNRWGKHVSYKPLFNKNRNVAAIRFQVSRYNPLAQR